MFSFCVILLLFRSLKFKQYVHTYVSIHFNITKAHRCLSLFVHLFFLLSLPCFRFHFAVVQYRILHLFLVGGLNFFLFVTELFLVENRVHTSIT